MTTYVIGILIIVGALAYVVIKMLRNYKAKIKAGKLISEMYPVWAAMGPYNTGEESGLAMDYAFQATVTTDFGKHPIKPNLKKHAMAYDKDPSTWENLRQKYLAEPKIPEFDDQLEMAKGVAAMDTLIDGIFKDAGLSSGLGRDYNDYSKIDDELFKTIKFKIGNKLVENDSFEGELFVSLLKKIFQTENNREPEYIYEIGEAYLYMEKLRNTDPINEVLKGFFKLNASAIASRNVGEGEAL